MMRAGMDPSGRSRKRKIILFIGLAIAGIVLLALSRSMCISAYLFDGIVVPECPDGDPVQAVVVESSGLRRNTLGSVYVGAVAHYTTEAADSDYQTYVRRLDASIALVKPGGEEKPLLPRDG